MFQEIISAIAFILPSAPTRLILRLVGHKIGKNVLLPIFSYIYADHIEIGNDVDIRPLVFIRVRSLKIADNTIISFGTQIKGAKNFITKGNNTIGIYCLINCDENVTMGYYSGLGPRSTMYTHGSFLPVTMGYPAKFKEIIIEDYVWCGMGIIILPGTYIESNCIINPGVVLKSRIKSNSLVELKQDVIIEKNLSRLQMFLKKSSQNLLHTILENFFSYYEIKHTHDEQQNTFTVGKEVFQYFDKSNKIRLSYNKKPLITYDLENFSTDYSKHDIHKKFLFFLRRRYGIILRTNYDN